MATIKVTAKKVQVQGLSCYIPKLEVYENGLFTHKLTPEGDPLINRKDALKYGYLHARDLKETNLLNGREFIKII